MFELSSEFISGLGKLFLASKILLLSLLFCFVCEFFFVNPRKTSLYFLFQKQRSSILDSICFLMVFFGFKRILENLFLFGSIEYFRLNLVDYSSYIFGSMPLVLKFFLAFLLRDFLAYWAHRLLHSTSLLWITHSMHHSTTRVIVLSDLRGHPMQKILTFFLIEAPMVIFFGFDIIHYLIFDLLTTVPSHLTHGRIDTNFGILGKYILVSPRFHHLHHANDARSNKNFGEIFVFWDRIFGTYLEPNTSIEKIETGIRDNYFERDSYIKAYLKPVYFFYREIYFFFRKKIMWFVTGT